MRWLGSALFQASMMFPWRVAAAALTASGAKPGSSVAASSAISSTLWARRWRRIPSRNPHPRYLTSSQATKKYRMARRNRIVNGTAIQPGMLPPPPPP